MPHSFHKPIALSLFSSAVLLRLVKLLLAGGTLLGGGVIIIYTQECNHESVLSKHQGLQRIDREAAFLSHEVDSIRADVLYLAEQDTLNRFLAGDPDARDNVQQEYVRFATRRSIYDQIRFLDASGKEVIRVNYRDGQADIVADEQLQAKTERYYYRDALKLEPGEVLVSEFDLNVEHGRIEQPLEPVLRLLTPVVDSEGRKRGLLALNYSGNHLLRRLNNWPSRGATLLVNSEGEYIQGPQPRHAWGWLLGHSHSFPRQFPQAWQNISGQREGQFTTAEGLFTFDSVVFSAPAERHNSRSSADGKAATPLFMIAWLPPEQQYAASSKLLKQLLWLYTGAMALLVVFGWYWARTAAVRQDQATSIVESEERLRILSEQLLTAQEVERRSISRELHDDLGQQVTAISLDLRSAARQQNTEQKQQLLARAIEEADHLLHSVHEVASRVRPSVLDDLGLHEAVDSLLSEYQSRYGITVTADLQLTDSSLPHRIEENVYRILQEGLRNIVRHAETAQARLKITISHNEFELVLEDQGVGFDPHQQDATRLGILGMRERTELLGGRFTLVSQVDIGTQIHVRIPLEPSPDTLEQRNSTDHG